LRKGEGEKGGGSSFYGDFDEEKGRIRRSGVYVMKKKRERRVAAAKAGKKWAKRGKERGRGAA